MTKIHIKKKREELEEAEAMLQAARVEAREELRAVRARKEEEEREEEARTSLAERAQALAILRVANDIGFLIGAGCTGKPSFLYGFSFFPF